MNVQVALYRFSNNGPSFFWDVMWLGLVVGCLRFGPVTPRRRLLDPLRWRLSRNVDDQLHLTPCNVPGERRPQPHGGISLKSRYALCVRGVGVGYLSYWGYYFVFHGYCLFYFVLFFCACPWHCVFFVYVIPMPEGCSRLKLLIHVWYCLCPSKLCS